MTSNLARIEPKSGDIRQVVERRAHRMLEARIRFVDHPDFDDSTATAEILGPMPGRVDPDKNPDTAQAREVLSSSDTDSQDSKFLTREQEVHLFRKMNFLKYQAAHLEQTINPSQARPVHLDRVDELLRQAGAIRRRITCSYVALVASIVKKYAVPRQDYFDLISEGTVTLIQASERFDCRRGARFSTYATWAIHNNFVRRINSDRSRRVRFATGRDELLQALTDYRASGHADAMDQEQSRYIIQRMLEHVGAREQTILALRFGLAGDKQTLRQVGQELGISKERVRQLETRAMNKLRTFAKVQQLYPVDQSARSSPCGGMPRRSTRDGHATVSLEPSRSPWSTLVQRDHDGDAHRS
jgi:RNA polymerase primary sigma factor